MDENQIENSIHMKSGAWRVLRSLLILAICAGVIFGVAWLCVTRAFSTPIAPHSSSMSAFTIQSGENFLSVGQDLASRHVVSSALTFEAYLVLTRSEHHLVAGEYVLSPSMSVAQIAQVLTGGKVVGTYAVVRIRDGSTIAQLAEQLQEQGLEPSQEFEAQATAAAQTFGYLGENPSTKSLEGYLFPDTYFVSRQDAGAQVISKSLQNFSEKVAPLTAQVSASGMSLHDVVTLASIVEREVSTDADRKIVAGIFLERMKLGMPLQSNATLGYVLDKDTSMLNDADLQTSSPYNDYEHTGLPPTPIGSPSLSSIEAVLSPTQTGYLYFIAAPDGTVVYAKTLAEQDANIKKYLQ